MIMFVKVAQQYAISSAQQWGMGIRGEMFLTSIKSIFVVSWDDESANKQEKIKKNMDKDRPTYWLSLVSESMTPNSIKFCEKGWV